MKRGFELLTTREPDEKVDFEKLEAELGFAFPPLFKLFHATFRSGEKYPLKCDYYLHPGFDDLYYCSGPLYKPLEDSSHWFLSVSFFDEPAQIVHNWKSWLAEENDWIEFGLLRIAEIGRGGGLFVGTRGEMSDAIYEVVWDNSEPYFKVADNMFEFIKGFEQVNAEPVMHTGIRLDQLYKNFGDTFWRVMSDRPGSDM